MLTVGEIRRAIENLSDDCEVVLRLESPHDAIHEIVDEFTLSRAFRYVHSDQLVIEVIDGSDDDEEDEDEEDEDEDGD